MRLKVQHYFVLLLLSGPFISPQSMAKGPSKIPFELCQEYLVVVKGSVGQITNIRMVIDTGALCTVITNQKIVEQLGLKSEKVEAVDPFGPKRMVEEVILPSFRLGPLRAKAMRMMVTDLYNHHRKSTPFDLIIGLDILRQVPRFVIDYENRVIHFGTSELLPDVTSFEPGSGFIVVPLFQSGKKLRLAIDTGAAHPVLYQECVEKHQLQPKMTKIRYVQNGREIIQQRGVLLNRVQFGSTQWKTFEVFLLETAAPEEFDFDGFLSPRRLGLKKIFFDFSRQLLSWKR
jgi:predicted aspartyl protease